MSRSADAARSFDGVPVIGRADIRRVVEAWPEPERYETMRLRVARYLPIWHAAYARYADAAGVSDAKRELQTQRMTDFLELCAALRAGDKVTKKRLNETESAISALTHFAPMTFPHEPWTVRIRSAALTARHFLETARSGAGPERFAAAVYGWAEIESAFPGDSSALLQELAASERAAAGDGYFDGHHLVYGRLCRERGLEAEGLAVYAAVADIMRSLGEDPGPFSLGDDFWQPSPSPARGQRADAHERFHGRAAPGWMR